MTTARLTRLSMLLLAALAAACGNQQQATPEEAADFVARLNKDFRRMGDEAAAAGWVQATYITADTQLLNARATERYLELVSRAVKESRRFDGVEMDEATARTLRL